MSSPPRAYLQVILASFSRAFASFRHDTINRLDDSEEDMAPPEIARRFSKMGDWINPKPAHRSWEAEGQQHG